MYGNKMCGGTSFTSSVLTFSFRLFVAISLTFDTAAHFTHIDQSTYEEGRKQFELIQHQSGMPHYGQCWKDAVVLTQTGCKKLTDDVQGRLALAYLNCFLHLQGRQKYLCSQNDALEACTRSMEDSDRVSFTTFFTHTQNICYFLQAQVWNERTEHTISELAQSSSNVAAQLHESSQLQSELVKQQNDSLQNQKVLLENAANLTSTLSSWSGEINRLFHTFKETTQEQRMLITDVFDQLTSLRQMVMGEFSGFYSILYYFFSVLVSYLLTSTTRTSGARFWLFTIVTASIFCEYCAASWTSYFMAAWTSVNSEDHDDWVYWARTCCRRLFALLGLGALGVAAYTYRDINTVNNQLLVEIRKQNSDLKRLLHGAQLPSGSVKPQPNGFAVGSGTLPLGGDNCATNTSVSSDSSSDDGEVGEESSSDRTYILQETQTDTETGSYMTADTIHGSETPSHITESLRAELRELRSATPLKEMAGHMERWVSTGLYSGSSPRIQLNGGTTHGMNGTPTSSGSPYMLRPRKGRGGSFLSPSPATQVESPHSFAHTVRQLERIAQKNSRMVCAAVSSNKAFNKK